MPAYRYRAVDASGSPQRGELECPSRPAALETLTGRGLIPIEVLEGNTRPPKDRMPKRGAARLAWLKGLNRYRGALSRAEILRFTDSLAALLRAGLTIDRALHVCSSLAPTQGAKELSASLLKEVRAGRTLTNALATSGERLPPYYISMIEAGEAGGSLPETVTRLADLVRRQLGVQERIRSALVYPSILAAVVLFTLTMLLIFVLPRFQAMFAESEAPLPWSTRAVLSIGQCIADYWWALALMAAAFTGAALLALRSPRGRRSLDRWLLSTRLTFGLPASINTACLLRTVSSLCGNGLPLPTALKIARGTLSNRCLFNALHEVMSAVRAGQPLSQALGRAELFPAIAVQLTRVGEETGKLDELLDSAATVLEEESQLRLERLLTLIVPLTTILMGLMVAALIGSVLIGLLSINDLAF